jgi:transcription antitermination factor NusG
MVVAPVPILRKESDFFPADLFSLSVESAPWEIVHVRSRQEKAVARLLRERGQPFYLPQIAKSVHRAGRLFVSFLPLFTGYVFARRTDALRQVLWSSSGVVRALGVADQNVLARELAQIRQLQESGALLVPFPDLSPGDAVRITDGVFSGYTGVIVRERDATRLVVSITALNKAVVAEFPRATVEPLRPARAL